VEGDQGIDGQDIYISGFAPCLHDVYDVLGHHRGSPLTWYREAHGIVAGAHDKQPIATIFRFDPVVLADRRNAPARQPGIYHHALKRVSRVCVRRDRSRQRADHQRREKPLPGARRTASSDHLVSPMPEHDPTRTDRLAIYTRARAAEQDRVRLWPDSGRVNQTGHRGR
jgi:hypothetical protein